MHGDRRKYVKNTHGYLYTYIHVHTHNIHTYADGHFCFIPCLHDVNPASIPKRQHKQRRYSAPRKSNRHTQTQQNVTNIHTFRVIAVYSPPRKSNRHKDAEPVDARKFAAWQTKCNSKTFGHYAVVCCYHIRQQGLWPLRCRHHCISTARPLAITL